MQLHCLSITLLSYSILPYTKQKVKKGTELWEEMQHGQITIYRKNAGKIIIYLYTFKRLLFCTRCLWMHWSIIKPGSQDCLSSIKLLFQESLVWIYISSITGSSFNFQKEYYLYRYFSSPTAVGLVHPSKLNTYI